MIVLPSNGDTLTFPSADQATTEGIVAIGGNLGTGTLLNAYRLGIFPWNDINQPIIWWSPDPRTIIFPEKLHVSGSLRKLWRQQRFQFTFDRDFDSVIACCADQRHRQPPRGTWITPDMLRAYRQLHLAGHAHSIEVWHRHQLVGGMYGVALGRAFFGESMFSAQANASKLAMIYLTQQLQQWGYHFIDCQVASTHLFTMGAEKVARSRFTTLLLQAGVDDNERIGWKFAKV